MKVDGMEEQFLVLMSRVKFITRRQTEQYLDLSEWKTFKLLERIKSMRLIEVQKEYKPYCYFLSNRGREFLNLEKPRQFYSGNARHQYLMRNSVELDLLKRNKSVNYMTRPRCYHNGFYPAVAEYVFTYHNPNTENIEKLLVVIDDYLMASKRLLSLLSRTHDEKKRVVNPKVTEVIRWEKVIHNYAVYCTSDAALERHKNFIKKYGKRFSILPRVRKVDAIWDVI